MQGPPGPANKLGAWCRSSPTGATNFQNPNFEIPSLFALWSVPAALRKVQKKAIPDFTSILALWSVPAALRKVQKEAIPLKLGMYPDFLNMCSPFGPCILHIWGGLCRPRTALIAVSRVPRTAPFAVSGVPRTALFAVSRVPRTVRGAVQDRGKPSLCCPGTSFASRLLLYHITSPPWPRELLI